MNKHYIIYKQSGEIIRSGTCLSADYELQAHGDELIIEGEGSARYQYVVDNMICDFPLRPSEYHSFNYDNKEWVLDESRLILDITTTRQQLLFESDWTDTVSAQTRLSNYNEWQTYRQALRDITLQDGYPLTINWPIKPE